MFVSARAWRLHPVVLLAADAVFAAIWFAVYVGFGTADMAGDGTPIGPRPLWLVLVSAAAIAAPIVVRRVWPLPALGVTLAGCCVGTLLDITREPYVSCAVVLYLVALRVPLRSAALAFGSTMAVAAGAIVLGEFVGPPANGSGGAWQVLVFLASVLGASTAVGALVRQRRAHAEREAAEDTRRALADERLRIARELHDVVAHSLSLIAVKAGVAGHLADRPQEAVEALEVIASTSRAALAEMRLVLGALRDEGAEEPIDVGLSDLDKLADYARAAGVRLELDVSGAELVPEAAALSAYRIVRESVTNVVRHAAPCAATVRVQGTAAEVTVEVADDGPGAVAAEGHGLIGMRERVSVFGGEFSAGARPSGGFRVRASLPYGSAGA